MAQALLFDDTKFAAAEVLYNREQIYERLPQKYEFAQLDGVVHLDRASGEAVAFRDVRSDEWWCRGHIPGSPVFPGVLMLEAAAQLTAFTERYSDPSFDEFVGFGGVDDCKFRAVIRPPARMWLYCRRVEARRRRIKSYIQGVVDGVLMFETVITGLTVPL